MVASAAPAHCLQWVYTICMLLGVTGLLSTYFVPCDLFYAPWFFFKISALYKSFTYLLTYWPLTLTFNSSLRGTKHVFSVNLAQICSAVPKILVPSGAAWLSSFLFLSLVTLTFGLWPWHSRSSERGTKHAFPVNLVQIRSAVSKISEAQTRKC